MLVSDFLRYVCCKLWSLSGPDFCGTLYYFTQACWPPVSVDITKQGSKFAHDNKFKMCYQLGTNAMRFYVNFSRHKCNIYINYHMHVVSNSRCLNTSDSGLPSGINSVCKIAFNMYSFYYKMSEK
jgi:hypothetical protein